MREMPNPSVETPEDITTPKIPHINRRSFLKVGIGAGLATLLGQKAKPAQAVPDSTPPVGPTPPPELIPQSASAEIVTTWERFSTSQNIYEIDYPTGWEVRSQPGLEEFVPLAGNIGEVDIKYSDTTQTDVQRVAESFAKEQMDRQVNRQNGVVKSHILEPDELIPDLGENIPIVDGNPALVIQTLVPKNAWGVNAPIVRYNVIFLTDKKAWNIQVSGSNGRDMTPDVTILKHMIESYRLKKSSQFLTNQENS